MEFVEYFNDCWLKKKKKKSLIRNDGGKKKRKEESIKIDRTSLEFVKRRFRILLNL